ncbi:MAG TPA: M10 family metallopeptidase [Microvirga sp.]|nr:M10 family metallopeptidase [Microvirga sp.]
MSTYSPTGDINLDGLLLGTRWAINSLSYSFPTSASDYGANYGGGEPGRGFEAFTSLQMAATRFALAQYTSVANLSFTEIVETSTQHADLRFAESDAPNTAWAYYPHGSAEGGDAWFNNSRNQYENPVRGNYANSTFMHEIGHALGLKHPHEVSGSFGALPVDRDSLEYSVMSYRAYIGAPTSTGYTNETWGYPQSLMMYDIAAIQKIYGANFNTNSTDTVYAWSPTTGEMTVNGMGQGVPGGNRIFQTVWDGGGSDTYDFSSYFAGLAIDLQPGRWSTTSSAQLAYLGNSKYAVGNVANALQYMSDARSLIENAKGGSGADAVIGNTAANTLWGNGGNDKLFGLVGADVLVGGTGDDVLDGGEGSDTARFSGRSADYTWSPNPDGTWTLTGLEGTDTLIGIETLQFTDTALTLQVATPLTPPTPPLTLNVVKSGTEGSDLLEGGAGHDTLTGLMGDDALYGFDGNDLLDGGGGADQLLGGAGVDTVTYATAGSTIVASLASGFGNAGEAAGDTYSGVENLTGGAFGDTLTGDGSTNALSGGGGDDYLLGGAGADQLAGGDGVDTAGYANAAAGVTASLTAPSGNAGDAAGDVYTLIENLMGGAYADALTGSGGANVLTGGAGNDVLRGLGGNDALVGGEGRDTAVFSGRSSNYQVTRTTDGSYIVRDKRAGSPDGTDSVSGVEVLQFSNGTQVLSTSGASTRMAAKRGIPEVENLPAPVREAAAGHKKAGWWSVVSVDTPMDAAGGAQGNFEFNLVGAFGNGDFFIG